MLDLTYFTQFLINSFIHFYYFPDVLNLSKEWWEELFSVNTRAAPSGKNVTAIFWTFFKFYHFFLQNIAASIDGWSVYNEVDFKFDKKEESYYYVTPWDVYGVSGWNYTSY